MKVIDDLSQRNNNLEDFKTINETITTKFDENQRLNDVLENQRLNDVLENQRLNDVLENQRLNDVLENQRLDDVLEKLNDVLENQMLNGVLEMRIDDQEQRSRNMCLLIHGVEENAGENTDELVLHIINDDLGITNASINEIQRSHRLGKKKPQRNLRSNKMFHRPINNSLKRKLKGKNISVPEDLTHSRYQLYKASINKFRKGKVWTSDGRITTKVNDTYKTINSVKDLD